MVHRAEERQASGDQFLMESNTFSKLTLNLDAGSGADAVTIKGNHVTFWKLHGEGVITPNPDGSLAATYSGTAGLIGKYTAIVHIVVAANGSDFTGSGTYTAANGDTLDFEFRGTFAHVLGTPFPNPAVGTGVYLGGTGRFVHAIGFDTFQGVVQADLTFTLQHDARLRW